MISKKFIRNSVIYTIAGSLPLASAIILLPLYIKYLSPAVYAAMALYTGFSLLVQVLITYSFDSSIYTYYHDFKNDKTKLAAYVSSSFTFIIIISLLVCVILAITGEWVFAQVFTELKILFFPYGLVSVVTGAFQGVFRVNSSLLQTQEKATTFLWFNLLSFSLICIFSFIGLYCFPNDLIGPIGGRFAAVAFSGIWVLVLTYREFGFHFDFTLLKSTLGFNHPSFIYQVIQWFNGYYDRVLMTRYMPLAQVGMYDFAAKCLLAIEFALAGFYNSFFPKVLGMVALQTEKKTTIEINRYYNGLTAVTILLVGVCIFSFPPIIRFIVIYMNRPEFLGAIQWIPFVAITYLLRTVRFYVAMPYAAIKYLKPLPLFYLIIFIVKTLSMLWLLPLYGVMGVIIAAWIGYTVEVVILFLGIKNKFLFKMNVFKTVAAPSLMALVIAVLEPMWGSQYPMTIHAIYIVLGVGLLAWAYRNELKVFQWNKIIK